ADDAGFDAMARAGYEPREAARICEACLHETEAEGQKDVSSFYSSHPATRERIATLSARALPAAAAPAAASRRHGEVLLPLRLGFLMDEVRRQEPAGLQILLERLFREGTQPGDLHFI